MLSSSSNSLATRPSHRGLAQPQAHKQRQRPLLQPHIFSTSRSAPQVACQAAAQQQQQQQPSFELPQLPQPLAEPLAYGRALASVLLRHAAEAAMDAAAEVSMQISEQPRRMQELAEEVQAAAERELKAAGLQQQQRLLPATSSASSSGQGSGSSSGAGAAGGSSGPTDLAALVDDLRADIAASRALLQQIRTSSGSSGTQQSSRR